MFILDRYFLFLLGSFLIGLLGIFSNLFFYIVFKILIRYWLIGELLSRYFYCFKLGLVKEVVIKV